MQVDEILIIKNAHENYGISTQDISQISRVPDLMPLPLRPFGVRGLCSVGGSVVSMVDMNLLLDVPEVDLSDPKARIISLNDDVSTNTLLVNDVYNTVEIDQKNIEYIDTEDDPVIAIYKYDDILVQVLSLEEMFSKMNKVSIESKEIIAGKVKDNTVKEEESKRFLIFAMQNEKYGLDIDFLQEIILADTEYTDISGTSEEVLGLITLREELLMVIDLRVYYDFESLQSESNRILVVSYENKKIGLLIDSIIDIKNIAIKDIEYMSEAFEGNKIAGVIHDEDMLISFFDDKLISEIFMQNETFIDTKADTQDEDEHTKEYEKEVIIFKLAQKEYAFDVDYVDEIIDMVSSTKVAFTQEYIDGIINIRGQIVATLSLFEKLNLPTVITEDSKIIICNIEDNRIGFIVDSVSDIMSIEKENIKEESEGYFNNVLHLDDGKRLILSMDIEKIVGSENTDG